MKFLLHSHSSYPRVATRREAERQRLPGRGEIDAAAHADRDRDRIAAIIHEQEAAGIEVVTDGQAGWSDPVSHLMARLDGVHLDGQVHDPKTTLEFRQPVVTGALRRAGTLTGGDFAAARLATRGVVKPTLTGPYTLARACRIEGGPYPDVEALARALSGVLAAEVHDLVAAGAALVQIDEPGILPYPEDIRLLRQLLEPLWAARGGAQIILATYGGDAAPLYAQLNSMPADIVALDLVSSPALVELIAATGASKALGLGVVDGRSPQLEDPHALVPRIEHMLSRYAFDTVHLMSSCGLATLPRECARAKLAILATVRRLLTA